MTPSSEPQSILQLFEEIEAYIAEHHALLGEEREEEMSALVPLAARLAEAVLALSPKERAAHAARMDEVLMQLGELSALMQAKRLEVAQELQSLSTVVRRANTAYRTTPSGKKHDKDKEEGE